MIVLKGLKKLLIFIAKEILSFIIKIAIVIAIIVVILIKVNGNIQKRREPLKNNTYIEVDLSNGIEEKGEYSIFSTDEDMPNFYNLLKLLDGSKSDRRVAGVILKTDSVGLNRAQIEELGAKLEELKESGKKIYSFSRTFDNRGYSLALNADEIIMPPSRGTNVDLKAYYMESRYLKRLTDKVGVKYNVIHVGDYKAFGETYTRETMSKERKQDLIRVLDYIYDDFVEEIALKRNLVASEVDSKVLAGELVLTNSLKLKNEGLIDSLEYYFEFLESRNIKNIVTPAKYSRYLAETSTAKDKIALIYADGNILYNGDARARSVITPKTIIKELERAQKDKDIKGIVLRIDSPGGSALASEVINAKMKSIEKPIYISMGGTVASGGYYMSAAGDKIYASGLTLTGSIGVVSVIPNFEGTSEKLGVNNEVIEKGEFAGVYSLFNEMTPSERKKIYDSSLEVYSEFKERVSEGRKIYDPELESIAGGRVWLGYEATGIKLVDEIGGLEDAIKGLAKELELESYRVEEIKDTRKFSKFIRAYSSLKLTYDRVAKVSNLDVSVIEDGVEENELLIRPSVYLPYDLD